MADDNGNSAFWAQATAPRTPLEAIQRSRRFASNPAPQPEAEPTEPETVVRHAGEFVGLSGPSPRLLTAEEMTSLRLGYGALPSAVTPVGLRDPSYQEAQHIAASQTSLAAAPATTKTITTQETS